MTDEIVKSLTELATKEVVAWLVSRVPFLGLGIFGPILSFVVSKILIVAIKTSVLGVAFSWIDWSRHAEVKEFNAAKGGLKNAIETGENIAESKKKLDNAFRNAIRL